MGPDFQLEMRSKEVSISGLCLLYTNTYTGVQNGHYGDNNMVLAATDISLQPIAALSSSLCPCRITLHFSQPLLTHLDNRYDDNA